MRHAAEFDLAKLLAPHEPETFFQDFWEKRPLAVSRNDPSYYHDLFSRPDLDHVIAFTRPMFLNAANFKPGAPLRATYVRGGLPEHEPFGGYKPDLPDVQSACAHGKTLLLTAMEHRWPAAAVMGRRLEAFFGCPVHTNLYLTPPGARGLPAHYDPDEVFILQIDGHKHWRFYGVARDFPLLNDKAAVRKEPLGAPTLETFLQPGDLLYIPRGHIHEAFTTDSNSLHLTVGVKVFRWVDLLRQALADAADADVRFRQSLPRGLLCADALLPSLKEKFQELLQHFASRADLEGAVGAMGKAFVSKLAALPQDYFAVDDLDRINLDTLLERAAGVICRVVQEGDNAVLYAPGVRIDGPAHIASALRYVARTQGFIPRALPGDLTSDAKLALVRRMVRAKLLTVAI